MQYIERIRRLQGNMVELSFSTMPKVYGRINNKNVVILGRVFDNRFCIVDKKYKNFNDYCKDIIRGVGSMINPNERLYKNVLFIEERPNMCAIYEVYKIV